MQGYWLDELMLERGQKYNLQHSYNERERERERERENLALPLKWRK